MRLVTHQFLLTLRSPLATVIEPAEWDPYYWVELDEPAIYENDGPPEEATRIRVAADNLEALPED